MELIEENYLTEEGLKKLEEELKQLKEVRRKEITLQIEQAKEFGDLSENAEYHSAKEEQAFTEGRIIELEALIKNAIIIKPTKNQVNIINIGSKILIFNGNKKKEYQIVGSAEANPSVGKISNKSPLGQAFLGRRVGEIIELKVPEGKIKVTILTIK